MISISGVRERLEAREDSLSPFAQRSRLSRGRTLAEPPCPLRTAFQRDRDRIIHSKAFRRLKHKTQVFIAPQGDHFVTRLTHTLEVAQVARTVSRALNLNEDLTEAIALGHDLGHTPFGHIGEETLNQLYPGGFRHAEQSLRVVDVLEKDGRGLNLTWEVRDGILNHSKPRAGIQAGSGRAGTLEGEVCRLSDSVAYINHDIGDAERAGVIAAAELPPGAVKVLGTSHSERINTMVIDIVKSSWAATGEAAGEPGITMSPEVLEASDALREFLFRHVYRIKSAEDEAGRARGVVEFLYNYFTRNPGALPPEFLTTAVDEKQAAVDYIAGMTDQFAWGMYEKLSWLRAGK